MTDRRTEPDRREKGSDRPASNADRRKRKERRKHVRKKTCISGNMINPKNRYHAACLIRDVDKDGCKIYSTNLDMFPDELLLHPQGIGVPIPGKIAWRGHNIAGVKFDFDASKSFPETAE